MLERNPHGWMFSTMGIPWMVYFMYSENEMDDLAVPPI